MKFFLILTEVLKKEANMGNKISIQNPNDNAVWKWQSNQDPWSKRESQTWEDYSPELIELIEAAHAQRNLIFEFGEYEIIFKQRIQRHKTDHYRQRPIKRVTGSTVERKLRTKRYFGKIPNPKTVSESFGSLSDFVDFLKKESKVVENIYSKKSPNGTFSETIVNEEIFPLIDESIMKEAQSLGQKEIKVAKSLLKRTSSFKSQADLWKFLIFIYTEDCFLYKRVNHLLREENWDGLNNLLPYVFFLSVAIMEFGSFKNWSQRPGGGFTIPGCSYKSSPVTNNTQIYLYRGTSMPTHLLSHYNPEKTRYFSWSAFTSTTKNKKATESFYKKDANKEGYSSVFFIIEATLNFNTIHHTWILDASKYSAFSSEEEVILPPGTIYEIIKCEKIRNVYCITLKIVENLEKLIKDGVILKGRGLNTLRQLKRAITLMDQELVLSYMTDHEIEGAAELLIQGKDFIESINIEKLYLSAEKRTKLMEVLSTLKKLKTLCINGRSFNIVEPNKMFANFRAQNSKIDFDLLQVQITNQKLSLNLKAKPSLKNYILELGNLIVDSGVEELEFIEDFEGSLVEHLAPYLSLTMIKHVCFRNHKQPKSLNLKAFLNIFPRTSMEVISYGLLNKDPLNNQLRESISQPSVKRLQINCDGWHSELFAHLGESLIESSIMHLQLDYEFSPPEQGFEALFSFLPQTNLKSLMIQTPLSLDTTKNLLEALPQTEISDIDIQIKIPYGCRTQRERYAHEESRLIKLIKETVPLLPKVKSFALGSFIQKPNCDYDTQKYFRKYGVKFYRINIGPSSAHREYHVY